MPLFTPDFKTEDEYFAYCFNNSVVKSLSRSQEGEVLIANEERVIGRKILKWSPSCGTYGQGGPGFVGFLLERNGKHPEEWLILRIWSAGNWLNVNGRFLESKHNDKNKPLYSNCSDAEWDEFSELVVNQKIEKFLISKKSMEIQIGDSLILLEDDLSKRNVRDMHGKPRELTEEDDLREAWIIYPFPWINI